MPSIYLNTEMKLWFGISPKQSKKKIKAFNLTNEDEKQATVKTRQLVKSVSFKNLARMISDSGISLSRSNSSVIPSSKNSSMNSQFSPQPPFGCAYSHNNDQEVSQHYILRTAFNGDYSSSIIPLHNKNKKLIVLDIGCGYGTWTMEMATQFPNAHFIGMDTYSNFPNDIKPRNCHFKLFHINHKQVQLPFLDNSIDYIFQRDLNWDLPESTWLPVLQECFRILKPGGWIEIVEPDLVTHSTSAQENTYMNKLVYAFYDKGQDPFVSKRVSSLMATTGFRRIQSDFQSIPLGWGYQKSFQSKKKEKAKNYVCSEFARAAACQRLDLMKSLQPWFIRENHTSRSKYDTFLSQLTKEWYHHESYINWHRSTAQKPYY